MYNLCSFRITTTSVSINFDNMIDWSIEIVESLELSGSFAHEFEIKNVSFSEKWIGILSSISTKWIEKWATLLLHASDKNPKSYEKLYFSSCILLTD